ncbi:long tail fiber protein distal subunit [Cronobacter phage LPCS28]|uniref:Long tail fiber protein Gp37 n=1 Tax=Cronobacter phage LPCS28 TaxID=2924885 RepID=A0AAE9K822_9CAUD|nr:long tail fiber protein distal subunit [Cronobacter phage LPCS28]UNY47048.1 hypothetical protein EHEKIMEA_00166 [Cronobacter phage LPCS28]
MALLKSGSTVGGNLIWHQGLLPLSPAGDSIFYKNYKIYTEKDKPTPEELNVFTKNQLNKGLYRITSSPTGDVWIKFGTLKAGQAGVSYKFEVYGGVGYNGNPNQNGHTTIIFRTGNNASSIALNGAGRAGIRSFNYGNFPVKDVGAIETSRDLYDLYMLVPSFILNSVVNVYAASVDELDSSWTKKWEPQATAPTFNIERTNENFYTTVNKPSKADVGLGNVTNDAQVRKTGDVMTGRLDISIPSSPNTNSLLALSSTSATPLILAKPGSRDYNISIQFKNDAVTRFLGLGPNQELRWGTNLDQGSNAKVYTTEFKPTSDEVQAFYQSPGNLDDRNLNDVKTPGVYRQVMTAQAIASRNYPEQLAGTLIVYRNAANNWGIHQEYRPYNVNKIYIRYSMSDTSWSTWSRVYTQADKPSYDELGFVTNAVHNNWNSATNGNLRRVVASAGGPESIEFYGITAPTNDDRWGLQIAGRTNRIFIRCNEGGSYMSWERLYHTGYKPSKADVGLGNVSNDAQIKRNGDSIGAQIVNSAGWVGGITGSDAQFRAVGGNYGFMIRNDGGNTYFLLTKSGDPMGSWDGVHPLVFNNGNREATFGGKVIFNSNTEIKNNGTILFTKSGANPRNIRIFHGGDATRGGRLEIAGESSYLAYFEERPNNGHVISFNGDVSTSGSISSSGTVTGGTVRSTGDVHLSRNARRHIRFDDGDADCYIYKDPGNTSLNINLGRFGKGWEFRTDGSFYSGGDGNFNNVYIRSDEKLKKNFVIIENSLSKVEQLSGYIYDKKMNENEEKYEVREAGVIAQELQKVLPESVIETDGILNVSSAGINALLINAIKELSFEVKEQRKLIEELRK